MIAIVTGGRNYSNRKHVYDTLDGLPLTTIVTGGCTGADHIAGEYAHDRLLALYAFPYPSGSGPAGGPIRNQKMIDTYPSAVLVVFPGGRGTADCRRRAVRAGLRIIDAEPFELKVG